MALRTADKPASNPFLEKVQGIKPKALDHMADQIERVIDLDPGPAGKIRALEALLEVAYTSQFAYVLIQKLLKDYAKNYLVLSHQLVQPGMSEGEISRQLMYNAGAWQALTQVIWELQPENLEKKLDEVRRTAPKM